MILIDFISHVSCGYNQIIGIKQFNGGKFYFDSELESIVCQGENIDQGEEFLFVAAAM